MNKFQVYSRYMKPPEILLRNEFYNLTADIWAAGAIFAGLVITNDYEYCLKFLKLDIKQRSIF